jgi:hypothetical protein
VTAYPTTFMTGSQLHKPVSFNTMKDGSNEHWATHETGFKPSWSTARRKHVTSQCPSNRQSWYQTRGIWGQLRGTFRRTCSDTHTIHGESRSHESRRRTQRIDHRYFCLVVTLFSLFSFGAALGSPTPFIDGAFETTSSDDDPDLIIVRERFNSLSRIQSIYLRFHDGTMDREILSGTLTVVGAEITSVLLDRQSLKESDMTWGIPSVDYGLDRGLEGEVPALTTPFIGADDDLLIVTGNQVRFWLSTTSDIDDFRVLVQYPEEHQAAHLALIFWHLRGRDVEGYPVTTPGSNGQTGGIVVGSLDDYIPDDGDFGEILSIGQIRLKTEDFDIQQDELDLGQVDHRGGVLGPASLIIDNFLNEIDYDEDNQLDQNGELNPVPNQGALDQLRVLTTPLRNEHNEEIPVDQIQVLGVPQIVEERSIQETLISVTVSPNTPTGNYRGFLTMWEDNNLSGTIDIGEPTDHIILSLEVAQSERPDVSVMVSDVFVSTDSSVDLDVSTSDAQIAEDTSVASEVGVDTDQGQVVTGDTALSSDAFETIDGSTSDASNHSDQSISSVDAQVSDSGFPDAITATNRDSGGRGAETWAGKPTGGGLQCSQGAPSQFWNITLLICLAMGRRRC